MAGNDLNYQEKLSLLNELVQVGDADGSMARDECEMIRAIAERLDVSDADLEKVLRDKVPFTPPRMEIDRILWVQGISMIIVADGVVTDREVRFMQQLGMRLGFSPGPIQELLKRLQANPSRPLPAEELIPIFQVAHN